MLIRKSTLVVTTLPSKDSTKVMPIYHTQSIGMQMAKSLHPIINKDVALAGLSQQQLL